MECLEPQFWGSSAVQPGARASTPLGLRDDKVEAATDLKGPLLDLTP